MVIKTMFVGVRRVLPDTTKSDQGGSSVKVLGPGLVWLDFWAFWWRFHAISSRVSKWINKSPQNYLSRALSQFICLIKGLKKMLYNFSKFLLLDFLVCFGAILFGLLFRVSPRWKSWHHHYFINIFLVSFWLRQLAKTSPSFGVEGMEAKFEVGSWSNFLTSTFAPTLTTGGNSL